MERLLALASFCLVVSISNLLPPPAGLAVSSCYAQEIVIDDGPNDLRLIRGLRERRLFFLANMHCDRRLAEQSLTPREQATLIVEKIINQSQAAFFQMDSANLAGGGESWDASIKTAEFFAARNSKHPFLKLVQTQSALVDLNHGEWIARKSQTNRTAEAREAALKFIRLAISKLEKIEREVQKEIPRGQKETGLPDAMGQEELRALRVNSIYQLSRALRIRASLYEKEDQLNRIASLDQVNNRHKELLKNLSESDNLYWEVQIDKAKVRSLIELTDHNQDLLSLIDQAPDTRTRFRLVAEQIRIAIFKKATSEISQLLSQTMQQEDPDLDLAKVEALIALSQLEQDEEKAVKYQQIAVNSTRRIEQVHGKFYGRVANQFLVSSAEMNPEAANLAILIRLADQTYLNGQYDDAGKAYLAAAEKAKSVGDQKNQFQLRYKAGLVDQKQGRLKQAATRFQSVAVELKDQPSASQSHLMAIVSTAQLASKDRSELAAYFKLLDEHLEIWPQQETSNQVRMWLGQNQLRSRKYSDAVKTLTSIGNTSAFRISGLNIAAQSAAKWYRFDNDHYDSEFCKATFLPIVESLMSKPEWDEKDQSIAAIVAELNQKVELSNGSKLVSRIEKKLVDPYAFAEFRAKAIQLVILSDLSKPPAQLAPLMNELCRLSSTNTVETLMKVSQTAKKGNAAAGKLIEDSLSKLAGFESKAVPVVKLSASQLNQRKILKAKSLVLQGRRGPALKLLKSLVDANSKNGDLRLAYAELLQESDAKTELKLALDQWRILARGSQSKTARWYTAKLGVAKTMVAMGDQEKAKAFLSYLKVTSGWDGCEFKNDFERLLRKL